jgi:hypothetical protein
MKLLLGIILFIILFNLLFRVVTFSFIELLYNETIVSQLYYI